MSRNVDTLFAEFLIGTLSAADLSADERRRVHLRVLSHATNMPIYEFVCVKCGQRVEKLYPSYDAMTKETDCYCTCSGFLEKQISASSFKVNGLNSMNGYTPERSISQRWKNGIRTEVKGNFEAFADKLA